MLGFLRAARELEERGVLGINRRNSEYVLRENPRRLYPVVDDKLETKRRALEAGMAVPELYGTIDAQHRIDDLPEVLGDRQEFVVKPAHGSGGNGILVITDRRKDRYRKGSGLYMAYEELEFHISTTLSGLYSLGGHPDVAMIEYRVRFDPFFEAVSYQGVPDVRIIVFRGVPVMAMVRLPTRTSDGKANLHQGAIGAGIDVSSGETLQGVSGNEVVSEHPDTGQAIVGLRLPHWDTILDLAARGYELSGLGYLGVDVVLDRDLGPLVLELNARPGLNVQIANGEGLLGRLRAVEAEAPEGAPVAERIAFARERFRPARAGG